MATCHNMDESFVPEETGGSKRKYSRKKKKEELGNSYFKTQLLGRCDESLDQLVSAMYHSEERRGEESRREKKKE